MKGTKTSVLTFGEKCKNILASNWQATLNTIKADATGSSISYLEGQGSSHEVDMKDMEESKADPLSLFSASLIDGIDQSETRRQALIIFCATHLNKNVKDALVLSIDRKGINLLGKVAGPMMDDGSREQQWKELRLLLCISRTSLMS